MHKPVADEFEAIAARLKEIEQVKQAWREKPADTETPPVVAVPDAGADDASWYDGY